MDAMSPEEFDIPVPGGVLRICRWPGDGPTVVALHGITANALSWIEVARALNGAVTLVAPDLRGRAGSGTVSGPYGLAAHADDVVRILDHLGLEKACVAGHSMGGYVAALAATRHRDRVSSVLLVDGGVVLPMPPGLDIDAVLEAVIGPAMRRLHMTFGNPQAYLDYWRAHPALAANWSPAIEAYVLRDLVGSPPTLRSSCNIEAIRQDGTDVLLDEGTVKAVHELDCPAALLWCERGLLDEPQGLYNTERLAAAGVDPDRINAVPVAGVNHYTVLVAPHGAATVASHVVRFSG